MVRGKIRSIENGGCRVYDTVAVVEGSTYSTVMWRFRAVASTEGVP